MYVSVFASSSNGRKSEKYTEYKAELTEKKNGFNYPYICNGNLNCYYEIERAPANGTDSLSVWQFFWGSQQMDVTPGHLKVMWLWDRVVNMTESAAGPGRRRPNSRAGRA